MHLTSNNAYLELANVSPLSKVKMVRELKKELRPISLTPNISKVAEHFVVKDYVKPAVLKKIDPNQYGAIPKSSTIFALLSMVHNWTPGLVIKRGLRIRIADEKIRMKNKTRMRNGG